MLFISTALYLEAQPFIEYYSLKQLHEHTKFTVFANDNIYLIITGVGELKASIAIAYLFSQQNIGPHDLFLNFGLCGSKNHTIPIGTTYAFHKIKDYATKRDLYPDMLLRLPFQEGSLETCPLPVGTDLPLPTVHEDFFDMEAYAIMYTITYYMQPHQIMFLKVISDYAEPDFKLQLDQAVIKQYLSKSIKQIGTYLSEISNDFSFFPHTVTSCKLTYLENELTQQFIQQLHLSETMSHSLRQHITYYKSRFHNAEAILTNFHNELSNHTCKNKAEGKKYFEQLKSKLME